MHIMTFEIIFFFCTNINFYFNSIFPWIFGKKPCIMFLEHLDLSRRLIRHKPWVGGFVSSPFSTMSPFISHCGVCHFLSGVNSFHIIALLLTLTLSLCWDVWPAEPCHSEWHPLRACPEHRPAVPNGNNPCVIWEPHGFQLPTFLWLLIYCHLKFYS